MRTPTPVRVCFEWWVALVRPLVTDPVRRSKDQPHVLRSASREQAKDGREFTRGEYHASRLRP